MTREKAAEPKVHPLEFHSKRKRKLGRFYHDFFIQVHFPPEIMSEYLQCTATNINSKGLYLTNIQHPFQINEQISVEIVHPTELLPEYPGSSQESTRVARFYGLKPVSNGSRVLSTIGVKLAALA